jgi:hypothetical protein
MNFEDLGDDFFNGDDQKRTSNDKYNIVLAVMWFIGGMYLIIKYLL